MFLLPVFLLACTKSARIPIYQLRASPDSVSLRDGYWRLTTCDSTIYRVEAFVATESTFTILNGRVGRSAPTGVHGLSTMRFDAIPSASVVLRMADLVEVQHVKFSYVRTIGGIAASSIVLGILAMVLLSQTDIGPFPAAQ